MPIAEYRTMAYGGANPCSKLETDSNGYRKCIVGAFDVMSRNGHRYPGTERVLALFDEKSHFMIGVREGNCRGESDHPNLVGLSVPQKIHRLEQIEDTRVCVHHKRFILDHGLDEHRNKVILVYSWLKGSGALGHVTEQQLDNPDENISFSVRSFVIDTWQSGIKHKEITNIITYDKVNQAGLSFTTKFDTAAVRNSSVGLENLNDDGFVFSDADLDLAIRESRSAGVGNESNVARLVQVKDSLGWTKVQSINPAFLNWRSTI